MKKVEILLSEMLKENTGSHFLDSGGAYGRNFERNKEIDFEKEPEVYLEFWDEKFEWWSVSVYHYLKQIFELDNVCEFFNTFLEKNPEIHWGSDLLDHLTENEDNEGRVKLYFAENNKLFEERFEISEVSEVINTYNFDNTLSQVLQYIDITINDEKYCILQIHGGCDVRGGYTQCKLFKYLQQSEFEEHSTIDPMPRLYGSLNGEICDSEGLNLMDENCNTIEKEITKKDEFELHLMIDIW